MIYFIEHDAQENIVHACADPTATIVPLINRVLFNDAAGNPIKDEQGRDLSPYGFPLSEPVGINAASYNTLISEGLDKYIFDAANSTIVKKVN